MPRCGCQSGQTIQVIGEDPISVAGNGTQESPFVVSVRHGDQVGCAAIALCVGENSGAGLRWNAEENQLEVLISTDAGNSASFGTDGGVFAPGQLPGPGNCPNVSIGELCAPGVLTVGANRMSGLSGPWTSLHSITVCMTSGFHVAQFYIGASSDGVACVTFSATGDVAVTRTNIPNTTQIEDLTASEFKRVYLYAGHLTNPRMSFAAKGVNGNTEGGWFGWLTQNVHMSTLDDILERVDGRMVLIADAQSDTLTTESDRIEAAIRSIERFCAQDWCMIGIRNVESAAQVIAAGCTPILTFDGTVQKPGGTAPTRDQPLWDLADAVAAGIEWAALDKQYTDTVLNEWQTGGVNVLMYRCDRHIERDRAETLGLCGYLSHDAAYTRGPEVNDYRTLTDPMRNRTIGPGMLSQSTSIGTAVGITDTRARGWSTTAEGGLNLLNNWGTGFGRPTVLAGWVCPLANPTAYTVTYEAKFTQAPGSRGGKLGLLFGQPDDHDPFGWPDDDPIHDEQLPYAYRVYARGNTGEIGIAWFSSTGAFQVLGSELDTGSFSTNTWYRFSVTVTATTISFRRLTGGTTTPITVTHGPAQGGPRGPYFFLEKEELSAPFEGAFRNITVS